ncbi:RNA-binding protein hfq [Euhalothece natronophila Z-M001]|uniref:RNA-binding protein hfq n=1 Tax=Euhalothece natronophila Z-M001 TaxID=522448 RepID=A0A5B8NL53_9CHRO|nr:RNA-binding protein hfq [Euhalothece natronophila]QDZ39764.1 RNA-binding protein hfq [Euhalothece natronophila Z-M001]
MTEFDTGLPSIRMIQNLIKEEKDVEIKLLSEDLIVGRVLWQDQHCLCLVDHYDQSTLVWRQCIAYLKPKA